jgi:hypothetical protein
MEFSLHLPLIFLIFIYSCMYSLLEGGVINEERSLRSMRTRTHCHSSTYMKGACTSKHRRKNATSTQLRPTGKPRSVLTYVQIISHYYLTKTWPIEYREINIFLLNDS